MVYFYVNAFCLALLCIFLHLNEVLEWASRGGQTSASCALSMLRFPSPAASLAQRRATQPDLSIAQGGAHPLAQRFEEQEDDTAPSQS